jgi:hypothetical protein
MYRGNMLRGLFSHARPWYQLNHKSLKNLLISVIKILNHVNLPSDQIIPKTA